MPDSLAETVSNHFNQNRIQLPPQNQNYIYPVFLLLLTGFKIFLDDLVRLAQLSKSNIVI